MNNIGIGKRNNKILEYEQPAGTKGEDFHFYASFFYLLFSYLIKQSTILLSKNIINLYLSIIYNILLQYKNGIISSVYKILCFTVTYID